MDKIYKKIEVVGVSDQSFSHAVQSALKRASLTVKNISWFEVDGALFLSDQGDVSARLEAEYELRLTQRMLLQPRLEQRHGYDSTIQRLYGGESQMAAIASRRAALQQRPATRDRLL